MRVQEKQSHEIRRSGREEKRSQKRQTGGEFGYRKGDMALKNVDIKLHLHYCEQCDLKNVKTILKA